MTNDSESPYEDILKISILETEQELDKLQNKFNNTKNPLKKLELSSEITQIKYNLSAMHNDLASYQRCLNEVRNHTKVNSH